MKERVNNIEIVYFYTIDEEGYDDIAAYSPQGKGDFDNFCNGQKKLLEEKKKSLEQPLGRDIGHRHGLRSLRELHQILDQRNKEAERLGIIISVLDGNSNHPLRYVKNEDGKIVGFDLG